MIGLQIFLCVGFWTILFVENCLIRRKIFSCEYWIKFFFWCDRDDLWTTFNFGCRKWIGNCEFDLHVNFNNNKGRLFTYDVQNGGLLFFFEKSSLWLLFSDAINERSKTEIANLIDIFCWIFENSVNFYHKILYKLESISQIQCLAITIATK